MMMLNYISVACLLFHVCWKEKKTFAGTIFAKNGNFLNPPHSLILSVYLSFSQSISLSLCPSLCPSLFLTVYLSSSLTISLSLHLSFSLSLSPSQPISRSSSSHSLSHSVNLCLSLSVCLTLCLSPLLQFWAHLCFFSIFFLYPSPNLSHFLFGLIFYANLFLPLSWVVVCRLFTISQRFFLSLSLSVFLSVLLFPLFIYLCPGLHDRHRLAKIFNPWGQIVGKRESSQKTSPALNYEKVGWRLGGRKISCTTTLENFDSASLQ